MKTGKTGTEVTIHRALWATLDAVPTGDMPFILGANEKPLTKASFANMFADACRASGVETSVRGLRKIAAQRAADAGRTVSEMKAVFGWDSGRMALQYTRTADRRRLAIKEGSQS